MILELINNPKLFRLLTDELTNEELVLLLNKKGGEFISKEIPFRLINLYTISDDVFYKLISHINFIKNVQNEMQQNIHMYNEIAIKIKKLTNVNDINYFFIYANQLDILDFFTKEFIEKNLILIKFIKDINPYIDVIIENKIQLNRKLIESLNVDNLIKLMNSNIYNVSSKTLLIWVYLSLIKHNKQIVLEHMIENKTFGGDYNLVYKFNEEELNLLFNSNPTIENYHLILNAYSLYNKNKFKFNNIIILEYDINTIIDLDKTIIKENYEYIKNLILKNGCGKSNLKRFIKINKDNLTEDIIKYSLNKIPLFVSVLLDKPISKIREAKVKQFRLEDLKELMTTRKQLKANERKFIEDNFNFDISFLNNWEYLNSFSLELVKQQINKLRNN